MASSECARGVVVQLHALSAAQATEGVDRFVCGFCWKSRGTLDQLDDGRGPRRSQKSESHTDDAERIEHCACFDEARDITTRARAGTRVRARTRRGVVDEVAVHMV